MYNTYLFHHGVKGQRWGIRRYQNEDGSLTPEGKKRKAQLYSDIDKRYEKETRKPKLELLRYKDRNDLPARKKKAIAEAKIVRSETLRNIRQNEVDEGFDYLENSSTKKFLSSPYSDIKDELTGGNQSRTRAEQEVIRMFINSLYSKSIKEIKAMK